MSVITDPKTGERFDYFTRAEWRARAPRSRSIIRTAVEGFFGHHSVTAQRPSLGIVQAIQGWHMDNQGWVDGGYSFLYDNDGVIYEMRGWGIAGAHTVGFNSSAHAFCFIGNSDNQAMSDKAKRAFNCLVNIGEQLYNVGRVRGHGDVNATSCPGSFKRAFLANGRGGTGTPTPPAPRPPATTSPHLPPHRYRHYRAGSVLTTSLRNQRRNDVAEVQFCVNLGLANQARWTRVDGYYGPDTARAVKEYQRGHRRFWNDATMAVDGKFGPITARGLSFVLTLRGWGG